jgi:hypothetical protein
MNAAPDQIARAAAAAAADRADSAAPPHVRSLDGLRGLAIAGVLAVHAGVPFFAAGWLGVDLFFVLSGFLITGILLREKGSPTYFKAFYARRVLRIFPLYYLFVIGTLVAFSHNAEFRQHAGSPFWYLAYLGNIPESLLGHDPPYFLAPVWSLAIMAVAPESRPTKFSIDFRGLYDLQHVGVPLRDGGYVQDATTPGFSVLGHPFLAELGADAPAVIEYLKTL